MRTSTEQKNAEQELRYLKDLSSKIDDMSKPMIEYQFAANERESEDGAADEIYELFKELESSIGKIISDFEEGQIDEYDPE